MFDVAAAAAIVLCGESSNQKRRTKEYKSTLSKDLLFPNQVKRCYREDPGDNGLRRHTTGNQPCKDNNAQRG